MASLALLSLLQAPMSGADGLSLANPRLTYGVLGPTRPTSEFHPGDSLILSFDIQGITADPNGKAVYTTAVEVTDAAGKSIFKQPAKKFQETLALGGATLPAFAQIDLGLDAPAGKFTMAVTVTDTTSQKSALLKQECSVAPKGFSIVRLSYTGDANGLVPLGALTVGQPFWVQAAVVGFDRAPGGTKQPNVNLSLRVLDNETKKPLATFTGTIDKDVPSNATSLPIRFYVPLNKQGSYTIELKAVDNLKKGEATLAFPITVLPHK